MHTKELIEQWTFKGTVAGAIEAAYYAGQRGDQLDEMLIDYGNSLVAVSLITLTGFTKTEEDKPQ